MQLLSHPNKRVVCEVLAFLESIMEFSNTHVQEGLKDLVRFRHHVFPILEATLTRESIIYQERYVTYSNLTGSSHCVL